MRFAFATSAVWPRLTVGDALCALAVEQRGHVVEPAVWDDEQVEWSSFDAVVIRSCWDYHRKHRAFLAWLRNLEAAGLRVLNDVGSISWNSDKRYLVELRERGVPVVESVLIEDGLVSRTALRSLTTDRLVVKPAISASSDGVEVVNVETLPISRPYALLVQPFLAEIANGEKSIVVFDGAISHAVLKSPAAGEFRVQADYGGSAEECRVEDDERLLAEQLLGLIDPVPLYARVDVVRTDSGPLLMELELIEPELFVHVVPESATRFAEALERQTSRDEQLRQREK
ncbi:MAG: hypothetical protein JJE51_09450 [Thermoanaerobaculia bacterium]|nr:hypothetical protein [Thermoanaerobaculia bacterium]